MKRIRAVLVALVVAVGAVTVAAPPAAAACNLHVVYHLYPWGGGRLDTTFYSSYRYFVDHRMGVANYEWVC